MPNSDAINDKHRRVLWPFVAGVVIGQHLRERVDERPVAQIRAILHQYQTIRARHNHSWPAREAVLDWFTKHHNAYIKSVPAAKRLEFVDGFIQGVRLEY